MSLDDEQREDDYNADIIDKLTTEVKPANTSHKLN